MASVPSSLLSDTLNLTSTKHFRPHPPMSHSRILPTLFYASGVPPPSAGRTSYKYHPSLKSGMPRCILLQSDAKWAILQRCFGQLFRVPDPWTGPRRSVSCSYAGRGQYTFLPYLISWYAIVCARRVTRITCPRTWTCTRR